MRTVFYLICRLRTATGFEAFGNFNLGNNRSFAYTLFEHLKGRREATPADVLQLDLMETSNGLPINLRVISCTAEELAANCKYITKEMFKLLSLENNTL